MHCTRTQGCRALSKEAVTWHHAMDPHAGVLDRAAGLTMSIRAEKYILHPHRQG